MARKIKMVELEIGEKIKIMLDSEVNRLVAKDELDDKDLSHLDKLVRIYDVMMKDLRANLDSDVLRKLTDTDLKKLESKIVAKSGLQPKPTPKPRQATSKSVKKK